MGIGVGYVGDLTICHGPWSAGFGDQVGLHDAEIVVGDVREGWWAFDVAYGVDPWDGGLEGWVDFDVAFCGGAYACAGEVEHVCVGDSSCCAQDVGC